MNVKIEKHSTTSSETPLNFCQPTYVTVQKLLMCNDVMECLRNLQHLDARQMNLLLWNHVKSGHIPLD